MKRKKVLLGRVAMVVASLIVGIRQSAAVEPQLVATVADVIYGSCAIDKDNNTYPVACEMESESVATDSAIYKRHFVIYNQDFSVLKEFTVTITDIEGDKWKMWSPEAIRFSNYGTLYDVYGYVIATQHLFNADDKWEVAFYTRYNDGSETYLVYNEDGELVFDLGQVRTHGCSESLNAYYAGNGLFYLEVEHDEYCSDGDHCDYYSFTSEASGLSIPKTVRRVSSAHPNPLPAGQTLTVDLADPAGSDCRISIFDAAGRVVLRLRADEGSTSVAIPSHRVRNGNFVYMVTENGNIVDTGKVIAQ